MNKTQNIHNCKIFIALRILFAIYNIKKYNYVLFL